MSIIGIASSRPCVWSLASFGSAMTGSGTSVTRASRFACQVGLYRNGLPAVFLEGPGGRRDAVIFGRHDQVEPARWRIAPPVRSRSRSMLP